MLTTLYSATDKVELGPRGRTWWGLACGIWTLAYVLYLTLILSVGPPSIPDGCHRHSITVMNELPLQSVVDNSAFHPRGLRLKASSDDLDSAQEARMLIHDYRCL